MVGKMPQVLTVGSERLQQASELETTHSFLAGTQVSLSRRRLP